MLKNKCIQKCVLQISSILKIKKSFVFVSIDDFVFDFCEISSRNIVKTVQFQKIKIYRHVTMLINVV